MRKNAVHGNDENLFTYVEQIKKIPLLTQAEEKELSIRALKGDEAARHSLINANLRLVLKIARAYSNPDIALMDLIQEGNMGLIRAAGKYDASKNTRFSTYASWWIRQAISKYLTDKRRTIRLPHRKEEVLRKVNRAFNSLSQLYGRKPRLKEIAAEIGVPIEDLEFIICLSNEMIPIDAEDSADETATVIEQLADHTYSPELALMKKSSREETFKALEKLKERERSVLISRYKLDGGEDKTLRSIGYKMGLSTETIRQIELKALEKLRDHRKDLRTYMEF